MATLFAFAIAGPIIILVVHLEMNIRWFMPSEYTRKLVTLAIEVHAAKIALARGPDYPALNPHRTRLLREDLQRHIELMHPKS